MQVQPMICNIIKHQLNIRRYPGFFRCQKSLRFSFLTPPLGSKGRLIDMKPHQYLFRGDEKYMCQVLSRYPRKRKILHQPEPHFPHKKFTCQVQSRSVGKIMISSQPFCPILALGCLSERNHSNICFLWLKNTCTKFDPYPRRRSL